MKRFFSIFLFVVVFANSAEVPSTEAIKAEIQAELKKKVASRIEPKTLALKYRLSVPVLPPTMARAEIERSVDAEIARQSAENFPNRDEQYAAEAAEKYPLVKLRETITVQVKRGGVSRGLLYENTASFIKVSGYRISKVDLVPESLALVNAKENEEQRKQHTYKRRADVEVAQERLADKIRGRHGKELFMQHGYVSRNGKWMAQNQVLDAAIAHETGLLRNKYGPHIKKAVLEKYGFTLVEGRWKRPEPEAVAAVVPPPAAPEPVSVAAPVATVDATPSAASPAIELPPGTPPEIAALVKDTLREHGHSSPYGRKRVPGAAPPPPPSGGWVWTLPSKPYSLLRDKDLPTREALWKKEMDRPENDPRYSPGDSIGLPFPPYKGTGTLRRSFFKLK